MAKGSGTRRPGGYGSSVNKNVGVRYGAVAKPSSPGGVSQIGSSMGNHATGSGKLNRSVIGMDGGKTPISVPLGNQLATNVGGGGPGTGRQLLGKSGTQCQTGPANPGQPNAGANKKIFPGFR
jgi:hypothetical protein